ncbi:MAG: hypothetical protein N2380_03470 [bacterium]|nr:hypothetical protein [bacterium]
MCRKLERDGIGWFNSVKEEIRNYLQEKCERLWREGISGADYYISAIGSAIEIFGRYENVMDFEGNIISADKLLDYVRQVVTDFTLRQILHNGIAGELSPLSRFYLLWRWSYGEAKVHFDDARKLAQSLGIDLEREWNKGFIEKEKEFIRVLGPDERKIDELEESTEMIDVLHYVLRLYQLGRREDIKNVLLRTGYGNKDSFYRTAQAISETLPSDSKEKKLLDGFLSGRSNLIREIEDMAERPRRRGLDL